MEVETIGDPDEPTKKALANGGMYQFPCPPITKGIPKKPEKKFKNALKLLSNTSFFFEIF